MRSLTGGMGWLTSSKPFDFNADPAHDPDPGFLMEFYHVRLSKVLAMKLYKFGTWHIGNAPPVRVHQSVNQTSRILFRVA